MKLVASLFLVSVFSGLVQPCVRADMPEVTWTNPIQPLDVDNDTSILSTDAMLVIDDLNTSGARELPLPVAPPDYYLDTNGDGWVSPIDPLTVIHHIATHSNTSLVPEPNSLSLLVTALCLAAPIRRRLRAAAS